MKLTSTNSPSPVTLCEAFQRTAAVDPDAVALRTPGDAITITWREYAERVRTIAAGLAALGVGRGDTVALMMTNRPEFHLVDTAVVHLGATPFSIYNTSSPEQIAHLFGNADNRVVVCEQQFVERIQALGGPVEHIVCVDGAPEGTITLEQLESSKSPDFDFEAAWRAVTPDDVATLIYTSGTTGGPKGVELTHANLLAALRAMNTHFDVRFGDRVISYLPSAHIADRGSTHYLQMLFGAQITSVADPRTAAQALPDARPDVWLAVPRVWEKIKIALESAIADEPSGLKRRLLGQAMELSLARVRAQEAGGDIDPARKAALRVLDSVVLSKVRAKLGLDQCKLALSGAAAIAPETLQFFMALGVPISEIWGMTETCAAGTLNPPGRVKVGTVGVALPGVELTVAADGEVFVRGPFVMRGYRNDPERTAEAVDAEGWLHTGDVVTVDADGYVTIVDRKKELIINAAGKNMSPTSIENTLKAACPLIGSMVVIGDARPYNTALIVLDPDAAAAFAARNGIGDTSPAALAKDPAVQAAVAAGVEAGNAKLSRVEQVKRYEILPTWWEPGGEELTPTMKLKRKPIAARYTAEIEALYPTATVPPARTPAG